MRIQLSDHFTYRKLLRFVASPVLMMVCISLYSIVDGFFVSNFVGKTPFAAVNLVMPVCMAFGTVGIMIGAGGSAVVSKTLGETGFGEPVFFHACLFFHYARPGAYCGWFCACPPYLHCLGRQWGVVGKLCGIL